MYLYVHTFFFSMNFFMHTFHNCTFELPTDITKAAIENVILEFLALDFLFTATTYKKDSSIKMLI